MNHTFNENNICIECGCSQGFVTKNNLTCTPSKPTIQIVKPELRYGEIACIVGVIKDGGSFGDPIKMKNDLKRIKDYSCNPGVIDWIIAEYLGNEAKWKKIEEEIDDGAANEFEEKMWKGRIKLKIEVNTLKGLYKFIEVVR